MVIARTGGLGMVAASYGYEFARTECIAITVSSTW